MRALAPRERRIVAVGLLFGAIALIWLAVVSPVIDGFQARVERREQLLARYRNDQRLLASIPTLRAEAQAERRTAPLYQISAPSESLAAEALKQRLVATLAENGGTVNTAQQVQADVPSGWVSVRADARINLTQLSAGLRRLENETPYVVVEYASIAANRALITGRSSPLDVRLQVSALYHAAPVR